MNRSVVRTLILSDWKRHRPLLLMFTVGGALAFLLLQVGGEIPTILGATWFFMALIVLGCLLPPFNVVNERKKQILPFLMSLPISVTQYTTAKLLSTVGMFLVPWVTLVAAAVAFVMGRESIAGWNHSGGDDPVDADVHRVLPDCGSDDGQRVGRVDDGGDGAGELVVWVWLVSAREKHGDKGRDEGRRAGVGAGGGDDSCRRGGGGCRDSGADVLPAIEKEGFRVGARSNAHRSPKNAGEPWIPLTLD